MNHAFRYYFLVAALLTGVSSAVSQKVGTTSMQFLKVMPNARATAMGDAYSTVGTGVDAMFWNPAGLALGQGNEFSLTYIDWIFDTYQGAFGYAMTLRDWGSVGIQVQYVDYGTFDEAIASPELLLRPSDAGLTGRQFHPMSYVVGVSYSKSLTDRFSTGATVKLAYESLFDKQSVSYINSQGMSEKVNTYAAVLLFDFGLVYNTGFNSVKIATSVQNFGASIQYAKEASPAPLLFRLGICGDIIGSNSLFVSDEDNRVTGAFEIFQPNDYTQQMHAGLEYEFSGMFALRGGYKFNYDSDGLTFGAGIKQMLGDTKFSFDYSYGSMGEYLGNVHRISLGATVQ